jgi:hypothetical protein
VKLKHKDIFEPIPHLDELPTDVYCHIQLKDVSKTVSTCSYSMPRKYKEARATLIHQALNANTVTDSHPLPRVDDILADCSKAKIWSVIDMTNSFFQMRVHPDDVHLTAVTTPLGLYEWLAMPMGLRNSLAIHQHQMTAALRKHLGKICHIYLDDIIVWSNSVPENAKHIELIMASLRKARLYCNPNKCKFF